MKQALTIGQVAQRLRVNEKTVRRWVQSGRLPAVAGTGGQGRALTFDSITVDAMQRQRAGQRDTSGACERLARTWAGFLAPDASRFYGLGEYWLHRREAARVTTEGAAIERRKRAGESVPWAPWVDIPNEYARQVADHQRRADRALSRCLPAVADVPPAVTEAARQISAKCNADETDFLCAYLFAWRNLQPSPFDTRGEAADAWRAVNAAIQQRHIEATIQSRGEPLDHDAMLQDFRLALHAADFDVVLEFLWGTPGARGFLNDGLRPERTVRQFARTICKTIRADRRRWQRATVPHTPSAAEVGALYGCGRVRAWRILDRLSRRGVIRAVLALRKAQPTTTARPVTGPRLVAGPTCPGCGSDVAATAQICPACERML